MSTGAAAAAASKAWIVATSVGLVEALKDQGFARWNYPIRCIHQRAMSTLSSSAAKRTTTTTLMANRLLLVDKYYMGRQEENQANQSEESLRKVMFLSCWGPN